MPRRWTGSCRRLSSRPRHGAAGRRRALGRRRSGRLGPRQHRVLRLAHRQARGRPARPGRAARRWPRQGDAWPSPIAGSRPASSASCSGSWAQRVLGQYDLALLSAEAAPGRLLFVEENIRATATALGVPIGPFRTWIALHETTHAFEFEAHPWLRPYLAERLERQLTLFGGTRGHGPRGDARARARAPRRGRGGEHWIERLMGRGAAPLFRETQAVMSLLEGFSDYVMDEVGQDLVPDVERISATFHERRTQPHAVRARDPAPDRHGPEARAIQEGRELRPRRSPPRRGRPRCAGCGRAPRRCRATARSTTRSAGSRAASLDGAASASDAASGA